MKYAHVYALFLLSVFLTSCGQNQTNVPKENNRQHRSGLSESELKEAATSKVPMSMVRNVMQARNGDILIASYVGLYRYDARLQDAEGASPPTGQAGFTNMTSTIEWPTFWDVLEDRKGNLWLASQDSGVYFQPAGQTGFKLLKAEDVTGISSALDIYEDRAGNIWFGASRYDPSAALRAGGESLPTGQAGFRTFSTKDGFPTNKIRLLLEDKTGKLWFGPHLENMFVYDPSIGGDLDSNLDGQGNGFTIPKNKDGKAFNNVWSIIEDKKGNIWFADFFGLWRYDGSTFTHVSERGAYNIIQDKKGNIWTTGEVKLYSNVWALSRYDAESLYNEKPTVTEIMSQTGMLLGILEDDDGNIWFGSGGGVYRYDARLPDGQGKTITDFKNTAGQK